jgi:N-acetyl-1-D-myo-inositol-2-amino-2-deoxy-alpha-D-glucopyranoside deacetylase
VSHPHMSDRAIGHSVGLAAIRKGSSEEIPQSNARVGRDGRIRPLDSGADRRRAAELLAQHPDASLRDVARAAGISPATVLDVRKRLERGESPVPEKPATNAARKGASGNGAKADTESDGASAQATRLKFAGSGTARSGHCGGKAAARPVAVQQRARQGNAAAAARQRRWRGATAGRGRDRAPHRSGIIDLNRTAGLTCPERTPWRVEVYMSSVGRGRCLLLVHAHPDDESIFTGATMARYAAEGARVILITCTMGERGPVRRTHPVIVEKEALQSLPKNREEWQAFKAKLRAAELEAACTELGVTEHRYLGGPGRWRDSGVPESDDPAAFWQAGLDEAAAELTAIIREVQPQVMVTYDANGFYGHPDHIQAYRVAWRAYQLSCDPLRTKFYALTMPRSILAEVISPPPSPQPAPYKERVTVFLKNGMPDEQVTTEIDARAYLNAKLAALEAHATQIVVHRPFFAAPGLVTMRAVGTEYYVLLSGPGATDAASYGQIREDDLFRGV